MTEQTARKMTTEQYRAALDASARHYRGRADLAAIYVSAMDHTSRQLLGMITTAEQYDREHADVYRVALESVRDREAQEVADAVGQLYGADTSDSPRVFPGEHEGYSDAARIVSWEIGLSWPAIWPETEEAEALAAHFGIWFEPVSAYALAVLPVEG